MTAVHEPTPKPLRVNKRVPENARNKVQQAPMSSIRSQDMLPFRPPSYASIELQRIQDQFCGNQENRVLRLSPSTSNPESNNGSLSSLSKSEQFESAVVLRRATWPNRESHRKTAFRVLYHAL